MGRRRKEIPRLLDLSPILAKCSRDPEMTRGAEGESAGDGGKDRGGRRDRKTRAKGSYGDP